MANSDAYIGNKNKLKYIFTLHRNSALFCLTPPSHHQIFFWKISENRITKRLGYKPECFKFTFNLNVTV